MKSRNIDIDMGSYTEMDSFVGDVLFCRRGFGVEELDEDNHRSGCPDARGCT